jgi:sugar lactone lactonase YvrE
MKRLLLLLIIITLLVMPVLAIAAAQVIVVEAFDPALFEFPEGIAIDKQGNIFVSLTVPGQVRRIAPDGSETTLHQFAAGAMPAGLAVDAPGNLYVAVIVLPPDPTSDQGVWRVTPAGDVERLQGSENIQFANGLAFDHRGNLYVTSSYVFGSWPPECAIWRIPRGGAAETWLVDAEFLGGLGVIPGYPPIGANGISFHHGDLYVANTDKGLIAHVPVLPDGSPGEPRLVVQDDELFTIDGIALDVHGTIYAALVGQDRVVSVDQATGTVTELAGPDDGVDGPSSLAFGTGMGERKNLFFVNYVYPHEPDGDLKPGVLKMDVGVPGLPLP